LFAAFRRFGMPTPWALAAVGLLLFLPSLIYFDSMLLKASIDVTLLCAMLFVLSVRPTTTRGRLLAGVAIGAVATAQFLNQLNTVLLVVPCIAFVLLRTGPRLRHRVLTAAVALSIFSATFSGFVFRDRLFGAVHYLPRAGIDMYMGLGPRAVGYFNRIPGIAPSPYGHTFQARMEAELAEGHLLTPKQTDRHYLRKLERHIIDNGGDVFRVAVFKLGLFFHNFEVKGIHYLESLKQMSAILRLSPVNFGLFFIFGALGLLSLIRKRQWDLLALTSGLCLALAATNILTLVTWRFRLPAVIPLALLSGLGMAFATEEMRHLLRQPSLASAWWRAARFVILPMLLLSYATHRPILTRVRDDSFADSFARRMKDADGGRRAALADTLALAALEPGPSLRRIELLIKLQRHTQAMAQLRVLMNSDEHRQRRLSDEPADILNAIEFDGSYVMYLIWQGDTATARQFFRDIASAAPGYDAIWLTQARPFLRQYRAAFLS
jgi:hypothetical protein